MNKIKIATVFSGIGAIEYALKRLNIPHEIVFACDNGERIIDYNPELELAKIKNMKSVQEKKVYVDDLYQKSTRKQSIIIFVNHFKTTL